MALFAYNPRMVDDYDFFPCGDELVRPLFGSRDLGALRSAGNLAQQLQTWRDTQSEVVDADQEFRIRLPLGNDFKNDEVKITTNDKQIIVHAKHEERPEKHCRVFREMKRVYTLPPGVDAKAATSTMNSQNILQIKVPKKAEEACSKEVPIAVEYKG